MTTAQAMQIRDSITAAIRSGADQTDWDASQFAEARELIGEMGISWDFDGWRSVRDSIDEELVMRSGEPVLGGVCIKAPATYAVGNQVQAGQPGTDDHDIGRILAIDGDEAEVGWQSGVRTRIPIAELRGRIADELEA